MKFFTWASVDSLKNILSIALKNSVIDLSVLQAIYSDKYRLIVIMSFVF